MSPSAHPSHPNSNWRARLSWYSSGLSLRMLALGFAAGLPLLLVMGTLGLRLRECGIDRTTIGFLSWVGLVYGFKWLWSPLVDAYRLPWLFQRLGQRRSWLMLAQLSLMVGLLGMAFFDPAQHLTSLVVAALWVSLSSATQDIALDAFRIECAPQEDQAALAAMYQTGYRLGMIWTGAGALWLAQRVQNHLQDHAAAQAWQITYVCMAASMLIGPLVTWACPSPNVHDIPPPFAPPQTQAPTSLRQTWARIQQSFVQPLEDFFNRFGMKALVILLLIGTYRISDVVMGVMANPFYSDMGYSKDEIAMISKVFGVTMTLLGAFLGGLLTQGFGVQRVLLWGAGLSALSNLLFAWLSSMPHETWALMGVICADNLSAGIASAAFIAFLSALTRLEYSASQYALLSSLMLLLPQWLAGFSGLFVDRFGYGVFFVGTACMGLPVLALVFWVSRLLNEPSKPSMATN